jgi:serine/threonine protein kinase
MTESRFLLRAANIQIAAAQSPGQVSITAVRWTMTVSAGTRLNGRYEVREQLGKGGMGVVWRGRDVLLNRPVAIKVMKDADPDQESYARFIREAQVGARLQHAGIVAVHDIGRAGDDIFIVMELLTGTDLDELLRRVRNGLPVDQVVDLMAQAAEALAVAHDNGVVHRDIKPANMFLVGGERLKVCDFGLARVAASSLTDSDRLFGTAAYMAPEQFLTAAVDARADLYSLGCVMYALLAWHPPFPANQSWMALATQHARVVPEPPHGGYPVPGELRVIVLRLLAKHPANRPPTARAVAAELRAINLTSGEGRHRRDPARDRAGAPSPQLSREEEEFLARLDEYKRKHF